MKIEGKNWVVAVVLISLGLAVSVLFPKLVAPEFPGAPEIVLTVLVIAGVIVLVLALAIVTLVFAAINRSDPDQALGLPQGSVRAVIALSLMLIFVLTALYLYGSQRRYGLARVRTSTGISEEMLDTWDPDDIVSIRATQLTTDTTVYDVDIKAGQSEASEDFANQILTTVSTLVVAIAAFYFGTRSVAAARGEEVSPEPVIKGIDPDWGTAGEEVPVRISGKHFAGPVTVSLVKGSKTIAERKGDDAPWSSKEITCTFNLKDIAPDVYDLVVVNEDGGKDQEDGVFTVKAALTVAKILPDKGKGKVGEVTIDGTGFAKGAVVTLAQKDQPDIVATDVQIVSDKQIKCTFDVTGKATGKWDVVVKVGKKEGKKLAAFQVLN